MSNSPKKPDLRKSKCNTAKLKCSKNISSHCIHCSSCMLAEHKEVHIHLWPLRIISLSALAVGTSVFILLNISLWAPIVVCIAVCLWLIDPQSIYLQVFSLGCLLCVFFVFNAHGSRADSSFWLLRSYSTPAGMSSCTRSLLSQEPYNAAAYMDYTNASQILSPLAFCPFPDLKWADATNSVFEGVSFSDTYSADPHSTECPECTYAPTRRKAYTKNLGRGLAGGFHNGASVGDTALCPGVSRTINSAGIIGRGSQICTTCTEYFTSAGLLPVSKCTPPKTRQDLLCWTCPGWSRTESNRTGDLRSMASWVLYWMVHIGVYFVLQVSHAVIKYN